MRVSTTALFLSKSGLTHSSSIAVCLCYATSYDVEVRFEKPSPEKSNAYNMSYVAVAARGP